MRTAIKRLTVGRVLILGICSFFVRGTLLGAGHIACSWLEAAMKQRVCNYVSRRMVRGDEFFKLRGWTRDMWQQGISAGKRINKTMSMQDDMRIVSDLVESDGEQDHARRAKKSCVSYLHQGVAKIVAGKLGKKGCKVVRLKRNRDSMRGQPKR